MTHKNSARGGEAILRAQDGETASAARRAAATTSQTAATHTVHQVAPCGMTGKPQHDKEKYSTRRGPTGGSTVQRWPTSRQEDRRWLGSPQDRDEDRRVQTRQARNLRRQHLKEPRTQGMCMQGWDLTDTGQRTTGEGTAHQTPCPDLVASSPLTPPLSLTARTPAADTISGRQTTGAGNSGPDAWTSAEAAGRCGRPGDTGCRCMERCPNS